MTRARSDTFYEISYVTRSGETNNALILKTKFWPPYSNLQDDCVKHIA